MIAPLVGTVSRNATPNSWYGNSSYSNCSCSLISLRALTPTAVTTVSGVIAEESSSTADCLGANLLA